MVRKPKAFEKPGRNVGHLMQYVENYNSRNIDELILIDIEASLHSRPPLFDKIQEFTSKLFCPLTLGGGIKTINDINDALRAGADKVVIKSGLKPDFIKEAS
mgnify:CR=1 FL=1